MTGSCLWLGTEFSIRCLIILCQAMVLSSCLFWRQGAQVKFCHQERFTGALIFFQNTDARIRMCGLAVKQCCLLIWIPLMPLFPTHKGINIYLQIKGAVTSTNQSKPKLLNSSAIKCSWSKEYNYVLFNLNLMMKGKRKTMSCFPTYQCCCTYAASPLSVIHEPKHSNQVKNKKKK